MQLVIKLFIWVHPSLNEQIVVKATRRRANIFGAFQQAYGTTSREPEERPGPVHLPRDRLPARWLHPRPEHPRRGQLFHPVPADRAPAVQDTAAPPAAAAAPAATGPGAEPRAAAPHPAAWDATAKPASPRTPMARHPQGAACWSSRPAHEGRPLSLRTERAVADLPVPPTPVRVDTAADPGEAAASTPSRPFSAYRTRMPDRASVWPASRLCLTWLCASPVGDLGEPGRVLRARRLGAGLGQPADLSRTQGDRGPWPHRPVAPA